MVRSQRCRPDAVDREPASPAAAFGWLHVGSMSAPCRLHVGSMSAPCRLHVGSMSAPCWLHVGSMSAPCRLHVGSMSAPCRLHVGSMLAQCRLHVGSMSARVPATRRPIWRHVIAAVRCNARPFRTRIHDPLRDIGTKVSSGGGHEDIHDQYCATFIYYHFAFTPLFRACFLIRRTVRLADVHNYKADKASLNGRVHAYLLPIALFYSRYFVSFYTFSRTHNVSIFFIRTIIICN